jgi:hypothetical protein
MTDARLLYAWLFRKFDGEINQPLLALIDFAEIEAGRDFADLIANAVREERGLEVAEDDALLCQFGRWALYIRPSIALISELTSMTSGLSDFKKLFFAHSSYKYHCIEDYFYDARMLPRNIVVLQ